MKNKEMNQMDVQEKEAIGQVDRRFLKIVQNSSVGIFKANKEGLITFVNSTCCRILGLSRKEALGSNWYKAVHDEDKAGLLKAWQTDVRNKQLSRNEFRFQRSDGSIKWVSVEAIPLLNSSKQVTGYLGIILDITSTKLYEKELDELKKVVNIAQKIKDEFLSQISHEIRTPINIIVLITSFIEDELDCNKNDELENAIISLKKASYRIVKTIDQILRVAEIQSNKITKKPTQLNLLTDVLQYSYHKFNPIAKEKNLGFNLLAETSNTNIIGDEDTVQQIFDILIENAIKYTVKGYVEVKVSRVMDRLTVTVSDTGVGISEDFVPYIYESFRQEEQGYTRNFDGVGLGLTLVKKYCELNNISIEVESHKNKGSRFTLTFNKGINRDLSSERNN